MFKILLSKYRMQLIALALVATFGILGWSHYKAYMAGKNADAAEDLKIIASYQKQVAGYEKELADERQAIKANTNKRISIIRKVVDPTGCVDTAVPAGILQQLDDSDN